jgi:hypothetical protein
MESQIRALVDHWKTQASLGYPVSKEHPRTNPGIPRLLEALGKDEYNRARRSVGRF